MPPGLLNDCFPPRFPSPHLCCSYQLCLFCYDRLKTEFSNRCPNCRLQYDCDFQAGLLRRQERAAQLQQDSAAAAAAAAQREPAPAAPAAPRPIHVLVAERPGSKHVQPPPPPPPPRGVRSPRRDLHIEQEQVWPSLGAAAQPAAPHHHHHHQQQHTPPQRVQQADAAARRLGSPPQLAAILAQRGGSSSSSVEHEGGGGSSSADTCASTPQSPASSVVCFRAATTATSAEPALPLNAASTSGKAPVQGRCAVVLQRGGGLGVDVDPAGASLAASLQEAVRAGSLSVRQAAASLASYLRQRQQQQQQLQQLQQAGSSAGSSPARGSGRQPSSAGSTPFSLPGGAAGGLAKTSSSGAGMLSAESSLAPCDSGQSVATSATSASLSHWAPEGTGPAGSLLLQQQQPVHGLFGSGLASSNNWQQQQQHDCALQATQPAAAPAPVGSPVRGNDRLPLFMRRGTLPEAQSSDGSPSSAGGSSSGSSAAGFPGFPSGASSPTQELKRLIAPPPGFGPPAIGSSGIAALPRFQ